MKKILILTLTVIMALSMAVVVSCKDSGDTGNTSASENSASEASNIVTVHFDLCTDLQTTNIKDKQVEKNSTINEPVVVVTGENPDNASVTGWYTDKSYAKQWNFETDKFRKTSRFTQSGRNPIRLFITFRTRMRTIPLT